MEPFTGETVEKTNNTVHILWLKDQRSTGTQTKAREFPAYSLHTCGCDVCSLCTRVRERVCISLVYARFRVIVGNHEAHSPTGKLSICSCKFYKANCTLCCFKADSEIHAIQTIYDIVGRISFNSITILI